MRRFFREKMESRNPRVALLVKTIPGPREPWKLSANRITIEGLEFERTHPHFFRVFGLLRNLVGFAKLSAEQTRFHGTFFADVLRTRIVSKCCENSHPGHLNQGDHFGLPACRRARGEMHVFKPLISNLSAENASEVREVYYATRAGNSADARPQTASKDRTAEPPNREATVGDASG